MSGNRSLEYLVVFTVVASESHDEGEESVIVQLAWGIISISKNQIVAKEQVYVCPGGGPPRSLPPGVLTEAVKAANNLDSALKQFHSTLTKLGGSTFSLLTFGPNSLRGLLHPQAYKICLGLQKYLHRYLDIIKEFVRAFPTVNSPKSVEEMAEVMGVNVGGPLTPGLEELNVISQAAQKFISQGHVFQAQEVVKDDIKLDVRPNPSLVEEECVVRLRGLPFQASLKDVAGFLSGLNYIPGGIVFGINSVGRRTGEAIVALETPEQAGLALQRHRHYMNQRYVEVYDATPEDFKSMAGVKDGGGSGGGNSVCVARLQGLPYRASEDDIVEFFQPNVEVKFGNSGVMIVRFSDGKTSGDGFACFSNEQELTQALQLNKSMIGSRYVELFKSSQKELELVLSRSGTPEQRQQFCELLGLDLHMDPVAEGFRGSDRDYVRLRGVPFTATPENIISFFGDLKSGIAHQGVHMVLNAVNRPSGECFVQMTSVDDAYKAQELLHRKYMDKRYVEVFQCSGNEVSRVIQDRGTGRREENFYGGGRGRGGYNSYLDRRPKAVGGSDGRSVKVRGLPYSTTEQELSDFFHAYNVGPDDVEMVLNQNGRPAGLAFVVFSSPDVALQAIEEKNGKHIGTRYLELSISY